MFRGEMQILSGMGRVGASNRLAAWIGFLFAVLLVAAASFNGFYDKWSLRDGEPRYSSDLMLAGQADRPFVYRHLNPWVVNAAAEVAPPTLKAALVKSSPDWTGASRIGPDKALAKAPDAFFRYMCLYYLTFVEWFFAIVTLTLVATRFAGPAGGLGASFLFALVFPVFLTQGGYFYDFPEMLFFAAAVYAAARGNFLMLAICATIGTMNKETMVFFAPTLYPFLRAKLGFRPAVITVVAMVFTSAVVYLAIRYLFRDNPGVASDFQLRYALEWYANPLHLLEKEKTYGLMLFKAYSLIGIGFAALFAASGWPRAPKVLREHVALTLLINLPLFLLMGYHGEMRNLSLTFVGWTVLAACAIQTWINDDTRNIAPAAPMNTA
jgi:hypothetical protein